MSRSLELYCALREVNVPAEKARAVVDALKAATAKNLSTSRGKQSDARIGGLSDRRDPIADSEPGAAGSQVEKLGGLGRHSR